MNYQKLTVTICLLFTNLFFGQSLLGYSFEDYKAGKNIQNRKARIDYSSNKTAKIYRSAIAEAYKLGDVDFAGYYITCLWGCGSGCLDGAMVDVRDGKVYDLPIGETRYHMGCDDNTDDDPNIEYADDSRLFISQTCVQSVNDDATDILRKEYFINVWNESSKRFDFVKSVKHEKIITAPK
jgi:hypothetical protein